MTMKKRKSKAFSFLRKKLGHDLAVQFRKLYKEANHYVPFVDAFRGNYFEVPYLVTQKMLELLLLNERNFTEQYGREYPPSEAFLYSYTGRRADCECCAETVTVYL